MKYSYPRPKPASLNDVVPHTPFTARDLCRVTQPHQRPMIGMICSRDGAWDAKYVITEILSEEFKQEFVSLGMSYHLTEVATFKVRVLNLGKFNSDDRMRPASRYSESEKTLRFVTANWRQLKDRFSLVLSWPIGENSPPSTHWEDQYLDAQSVNKYTSSVGYEVFNAMSPVDKFNGVLAMKAADSELWREKHEEWLKTSGHKPSVASKPVAPRSPEAILADFLIK